MNLETSWKLQATRQIFIEYQIENATGLWKSESLCLDLVSFMPIMPINVPPLSKKPSSLNSQRGNTLAFPKLGDQLATQNCLC